MQPKIIGKEDKSSSSATKSRLRDEGGKEREALFDFAAARLYEDENVLVIDKPAGVNSDDFEKRVHRLDKDTSGILLIAKNDKSLDFLQEQFKKRKVKKKYLALAIGNLRNKEGKIGTLLGRSPKDR
ncbi:pseudouridine synthase, partial [Patescibacteria group bacterium]|nr:pseudouridine synthase [Patescibacteria group bacterium]